MARRESPAHHLIAIASVAAISLVLVQTITERMPSTSSALALRSTADPSCARPITGVVPEAIAVPRVQSSARDAASSARANCFRRFKSADRLGAG